MEWYDDSPMYKDERERYFAMTLQAVKAGFLSVWEGFEIVYDLYHGEDSGSENF